STRGAMAPRRTSILPPVTSRRHTVIAARAEAQSASAAMTTARAKRMGIGIPLECHTRRPARRWMLESGQADESAAPRDCVHEAAGCNVCNARRLTLESEHEGVCRFWLASDVTSRGKRGDAAHSGLRA